MLTETTFDLEAILPVDKIRVHTKTDDSLAVSDDVLADLRRLGFEEAELYTGVVWSSRRIIIQSAATKNKTGRFRRAARIRLDYPTTDGEIILYGGDPGSTGGVFQFRPGDTSVMLPVLSEAQDSLDCCQDVCGSNYQKLIRYVTGPATVEDVPEGIKMGVMKLCAWHISHPGDEILTVRNRENASQFGIIGTNNAAWASGAIEQWRKYVRSA